MLDLLVCVVHVLIPLMKIISFPDVLVFINRKVYMRVYLFLIFGMESIFKEFTFFILMVVPSAITLFSLFHFLWTLSGSLLMSRDGSFVSES